MCTIILFSKVISILDSNLSCVTCSYSFDDSNYTIRGDPRCWSGENTEDLAEPCDSNHDVCRTMLVVDWMPHGGHQYGIVRECSETRIPGCNGMENSLLMFKDCWTECASSGCNNQTDVFELFQPETDPVESCKTCSYIEYSNGTVDGDVKCSTQNDAEVSEKSCPVFASTSCYIGAATAEVDDDTYSGPVAHASRGCSPFSAKDRECELTTLNGINLIHNVCKEACSTDNCNVIQEPSEKNHILWLRNLFC